jgi:hypothetical protein
MSLFLFRLQIRTELGMFQSVQLILAAEKVDLSLEIGYRWKGNWVYTESLFNSHDVRTW